MTDRYDEWRDFYTEKVRSWMSLEELRAECGKLTTTDAPSPEVLLIHAMHALEECVQRDEATRHKGANMKEDMSDTYKSVMKEIENDQEQFWNSLSKEDQLKVFCAVSRRIFEGELKDKGTYRHILYQVFGFGTEAYIQALEAGYLAIHNSIVDETYDRNLLEAFCKKYSIEDSEQKILNFFS